MDRTETLNLFARGRTAWNQWAEDMLARRARLEEAGEWSLDETDGAAGGPADAWAREATADFSDHWFEGDVDFSFFRFPYHMFFYDSPFPAFTDFSDARFPGRAGFSNGQKAYP